MKRNFIGFVIAFGIGFVVYLALRPSPPPPPRVIHTPEGPPRAKVRTGASDVTVIPMSVDPDPAGELQLEGLVFDKDEQPAPHAMVAIDLSPPRSVIAGADGTFAFTHLPPRTYVVQARLGNAVSLPVSAKVSSQSPPVLLHLQEGATVEVLVTDNQRRQGIAGAMLELRGLGGQSAVTDGGGKARLSGLLSGRYTIKASATGHVSVVQSIHVGDPSPVPFKIELELGSGVAAAGQVVDPEGRPVPGAIVWAESTSTINSLQDPIRDGVRSDQEGRWRFSALAPGTYRFLARDSIHAPGASSPVQVGAANEPAGIVITLPLGARIAGRVVTRNNEPVASAKVRVVAGDGSIGHVLAREVHTMATGEFLVEGLPRKNVDVVALGENATSLTEKFDLRARPDLSAVTLVLAADWVLRGRVLKGSGGQLVPEAVVTAEPVLGTRRNRIEATLRDPLVSITGQDGHFELTGLQSIPYIIKVAPPGTHRLRRVSWLRAGTKVEPRTPEVTLRLEGDGEIRGRLIRDDGVVPEVFTVHLSSAISTGGLGQGGEFTIPRVPAGVYTLTFTGGNFSAHTLSGIEVKPDAVTDVGTVTVQTGRRIQGRVLSESGTPVPGATVTASRAQAGNRVVTGPAAVAAGDVRQTTSREDGSFTLDGISISPVDIGGHHPQHGRSSFTSVPPGVEEVNLDITLKPTGILTGLVTHKGQPLEGIVVLASAPGAPAGGAGATTGTDGYYQFDALTPGTYSVAAVVESDSGQQIKRSSALVKVGEVTQLDFDLVYGEITLVVQTVSETAGPPRSAQLLLSAVNPSHGVQGPGREQDGGNVQIQTAQPGQAVRFSNLVPGAYRLCATVPPSSAAGGAGKPPSPVCKYVGVTESPNTQSTSITLPAS